MTDAKLTDFRMATQDVADEDPLHRVHMIGIGGAGMGGIAEILLDLGCRVTGSDLKESAITRRLGKMGASITHTHEAANVADCDIVVFSSAIKDDNPEMVAARVARIPLIPRAGMLNELMRLRCGIAVAGTHGKTTTSGLLTSLMMKAGLDPTFVIGSPLNSTGARARLGKGEYLVAEADESDKSFLLLNPILSIITNINADHLVNYDGDFERLRRTFLEFIHRLPFYGLAVLCLDDPGIAGLIPRISRPVLTYGIESNANLRAHDIRQEELVTYFTVSRRNRPDWVEVRLPMPGRHNVLNALAAIGVAHKIGLSDEAIRNGLTNFKGIGQRFQLSGEVEMGNRRVLLVDDYAHHPREITATLQAARNAWPERRIVVLFQPNRYTRVRDLFDEFSKVLADIDVLLLLDICAAGEAPIPGVDSRALGHAIRARNKVDPILIDNFEGLAPTPWFKSCATATCCLFLAPVAV
uniref:UDP-N-acetylmuramate--L-alanine ligase n=1 Tax=Candidatus Kentrum sp. UNK TaxID=2126344 RepID=A0A451AWV1_9GAMM|nr:MAG: UDP-N-acetylmuramate--L-alanine ligase [Candidatus Kentron sp. UNK]VFK70531.1 MAG: UDP-N-acetylmuramate--L-alanine ligase [Candidatus Kentron sp. UNK]